MRIRIQFEKLGAIRFTSHKDAQRILERCFAAAGVPVAWSEGFHPHMRMSFGPPIRTGWESHQEFLDVQLHSPMDGVAQACNAKLPEGFRLSAAAAVDDAVPKLATDIAAVTMLVTVERTDAPGATPESVHAAIAERFLNTNTPSADSGEPEITDAEVVLKEDTIRIRYTSSMRLQRIVTPEKLVSATIGDPDSFRVPIKVVRLAQYVARDGRLVSPIDEGVVQPNA